MAMKNVWRTNLIILGGVVLVTSALQLMTFWLQRPDIWWTPKALSVPVTDASDRVEVYVRDVLVQDLVKAGRLQVGGDGGATGVSGSEIRLRFNNWDRVRAERIPSLVVSAFFAGAAAVVLLLGILGWAPSRAQQSTGGAPR